MKKITQINKKKLKGYWVYILLVSNGYYYTGYTSDLEKRYKAHVSGKANCKFTKTFPPVKIQQCWKIQDEKGMAMKIESFIKSKSRKIKDDIVKNPEKLKKMLQKKTGFNVKIKHVNPVFDWR